MAPSIVGGEIGDEVHLDTDQILTFISGTSHADLHGQTHPIEAGHAGGKVVVEP